jgi:hypothetical protein
VLLDMARLDKRIDARKAVLLGPSAGAPVTGGSNAR